ncbi:YjjG family noncanonical pyrimidine nucleotidase [Prolixibacteraceae bacterium Z1-6]|uniref:YjjG family noncanonical pyrimidine nucleotidase n=1 Tax=Draconibacterium aestuarii TaxID=2998507 RepID=A0A9X3F1V1_9BACT|nr:YjjG family noncanonical pyrimidine nucleotidase [Prolixibacteraceae bacterium Z1-6]
MKKKYTHIFFDLDNTLWDFRKNSRCAMEVTYNNFEIAELGVEFDRFYECYSENNTALWTAYRKKEVRKNELTRQRFQLTFDALSIKGIEPDQMNDYYLTEMPKQVNLIEGALDILEYLKAKRYKLFIITNGFREVQYKKLQNSGLGTYFEKVFISEDIKTPKPGNEIFEYAIKSANAKKVNSLMVGDDWDVDIMGAYKFGIDAVYLQPGIDQKATDEHGGVGKILNLNELVLVL